MNKEEIKEHVKQLIKTFIQYATALQKSSDSILRKGIIFKCKCLNPDYNFVEKEFCPSFSCNNYEVTYIDEYKLFKKFINQYKTSIENIAEKLSSLGINKPMDFLKKLLRIVATDYAEESINMDDYISILEAELFGKPAPLRLYVLLSGLWLETNRIHLVINDYESIVIRRPLVEEVENYLATVLHIPFMALRPYSSLIPSSIIEIRNIVQDQRSISMALLDKLLIALSLYKLVLVVPLEIFIKRSTIFLRESFRQKPMYSLIDNIPKDLQKTIYKKETKKLKDFIKWIYTRLPSKDIFYTIHKPKEPLELAISLYLQALFECAMGNRPRGLMFSVIGLESLFYDGGGEISYKLRMRAAKLLSLLNYDSKDVLKNIKEAYKNRSSFVHEGKIDSGQDSLIEATNTIMEYLRASIIAFIALNMNKKDIINKIDRAMLSKKEEQELSTLLEEIKQYTGADYL